LTDLLTDLLTDPRSSAKGSNMLYRLIYSSRGQPNVAAIELSQAIRMILDTSRRNNPALGVTGALMFNAGYFAQVLEGSAHAVEQLLARIIRDRRHHDVAVLSRGDVPARAFSDWSMALIGASKTNPLRYSPLASDSAYNPSLMSSDELVDTLGRLIREVPVGVT
jgi:hypothetical protein